MRNRSKKRRLVRLFWQWDRAKKNGLCADFHCRKPVLIGQMVIHVTPQHEVNLDQDDRDSEDFGIRRSVEDVVWCVKCSPEKYKRLMAE